MIGDQVSFADAHYTLNASDQSRTSPGPTQSPDVKRQLTFDQQRELLEFVREHEECDKQEREAEQAAEAARKKQYEALKAGFEPEDGE
jgi:hypothetical protein